MHKKRVAEFPLWLEKLEKLKNDPFFRICLEKLETIDFSPALAGKAVVKFFGPNAKFICPFWKSNVISQSYLVGTIVILYLHNDFAVNCVKFLKVQLSCPQTECLAKFSFLIVFTTFYSCC